MESESSDEGQLRRKQGDLAVIIETLRLCAEIRAEPSLDKCRKLGGLFHRIQWKEDDPSTIRNKHGRRNRHKDHRNQLNKTGAFLDFEALSRWRDYPDDESFARLFAASISTLEWSSSLNKIIKKLQFILVKEFDYLTPEQKAIFLDLPRLADDFDAEEVGYISDVCLLAYDFLGMNRLLNSLRDIETLVVAPRRKEGATSLLDSNYLEEKIFNYQLGYLFSMLGETAKELSEILKPEKKKVAEDNLLRFLFSKIGHYRQEIKNRPSIVAGEDSSVLINMYEFLRKAAPDLKRIFQAVQDKLQSAIDNRSLSDYKKISDDTEKALKEEIQKVTWLLHTAIEAHEIEEKLNAQIQEKETTINVLNEAIESVTNDLETLTRASGGAAGASSSRFSAIKDTFFESRTAKQILHFILKTDNETIDRAEFSALQKNLIKFVRSIQLTHNPSLPTEIDPLAMEQISSRIGKYQSAISYQTKKLLGIDLADDSDLYEIFREITFFEDEDKSRSLNEKKQTLSEKKKVQEKVLEEVKEKQEKFRTIGIRIQKPVKKIVEGKKLLNHEFYIVQIIQQLEFLSLIFLRIQHVLKEGSLKAARQFILAEKMAFGFLGQLFKDLLNEELKEKITPFFFKESFLLRDMFQAMLIRHQQISHNMFHCDDAVVMETLQEQILPWLDEFSSMAWLFYDPSVIENPMTTFTLSDDRMLTNVSEFNQEEKRFYFIYKKLAALNRFLHSEKALTLLHDTHLPSHIHPELQMEIGWQGTLAYRNLNRFEECTVLLKKLIPIARKINLPLVRARKLYGLYCDLGLAYYQIDDYSRSTLALKHVIESDNAFPDQILGACNALIDLELLKGTWALALARAEVIFLKYQSLFKKIKPIFFIQLVQSMVLGYLNNFQILSARDGLRLLSVIWKKDFPRLVSALGQQTKYIDLISAKIFIPYALLEASIHDDDRIRQEKYQLIYRQLVQHQEEISLFRILEQMPDYHLYLLQLSVLNDEYEITLSLLPDDSEIEEIELSVVEGKIRTIASAVLDYRLAAAQDRRFLTVSELEEHKQHLIESVKLVERLLFSQLTHRIQRGEWESAKLLAEKMIISRTMEGFIRFQFQTYLHDLIRRTTTIDGKLLDENLVIQIFEKQLREWIQKFTIDWEAMRQFAHDQLSGNSTPCFINFFADVDRDTENPEKFNRFLEKEEIKFQHELSKQPEIERIGIPVLETEMPNYEELSKDRRLKIYPHEGHRFLSRPTALLERLSRTQLPFFGMQNADCQVDALAPIKNEEDVVAAQQIRRQLHTGFFSRYRNELHFVIENINCGDPIDPEQLPRRLWNAFK